MAGVARRCGSGRQGRGIGVAAGDRVACRGVAGSDTAPSILTFSVIPARQPIRTR